MIEARRPGGRRIGALLLVMAFVAGACGSTSPSAIVPPSSPLPSVTAATGSPEPSSVAQGSPGPAPSTTGSVAWTDCSAPFQCATVSVPIDYANPANGSIDLALIRLPATDPSTRIGDLLTNPGGPGESGVDFVRQAGQTTFSAALRAQFDIIGFDPRGVGASDPVKCVDGPTMDRLNELDLFPTTAAQRTALFDGAKTFDAGCEANSGSLLPFMTTVDAARDMDQIRIVLGDPKLTYLGFSYGTFLGSTYADLYPGNIRALVLDGAVDATLSYTDGLQQQTRSFAGSFTRFLAACAADPSCPFYNGGQPGPAYDRLMAGIEAHPLPATALGDPRPVGPSEAFIGVITALYDQSAWPILEQGLAKAQAGDGSVLLELADLYFERNANGTYNNISAANTAVNCADYVAPTDPATYIALANQLATQIPRFGEPSVYFSLDCAYWPFHPSHDPVAPSAKGAPPIVVVGTTGDPATPYAWAQKLAGELSSGVLLTRTGEGHTAYGKSDCIDGLVDSYLLTLAVPKAGTVCAS
ncbi:MAG TPA: alpha/beta hydrolase [Candidatus Limnocylindrales bacterium]|nr:alpha/beta hydrolase [Candidatus Limnocylindrales bacterium]